MEKNVKNENIENNLNLNKKNSKRISLKEIEESDNNSKKSEILSKLCMYKKSVYVYFIYTYIYTNMYMNLFFILTQKLYEFIRMYIFMIYVYMYICVLLHIQYFISQRGDLI
jgi:hypothetical protein